MFQRTQKYFPETFSCFSADSSQYINVLFSEGRAEGANVIYKYREALFHGPLLPGPETRGLSLMHRDNIGGRIQGKLLSCTQKRQIEKFIFNGQKASLARQPARLPFVIL